MSGGFEVRGVTGLVANLRAFDRIAVAEIGDAMERGAKDTRDLARQLCAVDTGFMREHLDYELTPERRAYTVGWKPEDFAEAGLPFYPPFVELGTSNSPAQPSLFPAHETMQPHVQSDIGAALRRSIEGSAK